MRNIYPVKYYSDEGFVEHKIELGDEDLEETASIWNDMLISTSTRWRWSTTAP